MHHASEAVQYARLIRPFSTRRLDRALWHVETTASGIYQRKLKLLVEPPTDAATWAGELERLQGELEVLSEQCEEAFNRLGLLIRSAPGDEARALSAMTRVLQGISAAGPPEAGEAPTLRAA